MLFLVQTWNKAKSDMCCSSAKFFVQKYYCPSLYVDKCAQRKTVCMWFSETYQSGCTDLFIVLSS